jgi:FkbM family methyltransferase
VIGEVAQIRSAFSGWPGLVAKGFLWKHLGLPDREVEVTTRDGTRIVVPLVRNIGALYTAIDVFAFDAYEWDWELEEAPFVVDIGANIGAWVLRVAQQRPGVTGVCYEPDPAAVTYLARNLALNGLVDAVQVRTEAVSGRSGMARLFQAEPGDGTSSLRAVSHATEFKQETRVRTVSFADAMTQISHEVSLLKMDCEGAEYDIVRNSPRELWEGVKRAVVEYHPGSPDDIQALRAQFLDFGFVVVNERHRGAGEGTLWLARR